MGFSILPHPLINFEIQKYYQNETRFNEVFSEDNLPKKIKDGAYVINLDDIQMIHIGLFDFVKEVKFLISIVLGLNMFLNKLKNLSGIKTSKLTFFEYKQTIQSYVVTFALYFLILCSQVKKTD